MNMIFVFFSRNRKDASSSISRFLIDGWKLKSKSERSLAKGSFALLYILSRLLSARVFSSSSNSNPKNSP
jgi:hypothetical protein